MVSIRGTDRPLCVIHGTASREICVFGRAALKIVENRPMTAIRETMRSHDLHGTQQAALSPAARAVYERLVSGTYEIDLERLADALLARFETAAPCCARVAGGPCDAAAAPEAPEGPEAAPDGPHASLSRAR